MPDTAAPDLEQVDFIYCPEQPLSAEQRIELLEAQMAEMREQIAALAEQVNWLAASDS